MLQKIKHLLQRLVICSKAFPGNAKEFGIKVAALQFWDVLIPTGKSKTYIEALSAYMVKEMTPLTQRYNRGQIPAPSPKQKLEKTPVWVCWWQGEDSMPPIVRACVKRIANGLPQWVQLHILTWDNYREYIDLPAYILAKHESGLIGLAHLSDILRFGLLRDYGGAWIDATVYLSKGLPEKMLTEAFYTQRFASWSSCPQEACRGKWCGFFLGGKADNIIFPFMYEALLHWWCCHDCVIDYVFFDYILWAAYSSISTVKGFIDAVPPGNERIWLLNGHLNDAYISENYEAMLSANDFF